MTSAVLDILRYTARQLSALVCQSKQLHKGKRRVCACVWVREIITMLKQNMIRCGEKVSIYEGNLPLKEWEKVKCEIILNLSLLFTCIKCSPMSVCLFFDSLSAGLHKLEQRMSLGLDKTTLILGVNPVKTWIVFLTFLNITHFPKCSFISLEITYIEDKTQMCSGGWCPWVCTSRGMHCIECHFTKV